MGVYYRNNFPASSGLGSSVVRGHSLVFLSLHLSFPGYEMRINICLQEAAVVRINWLVLREPFEDERPSLQMLSKLRTCLALMSQVKPERTAGD